MTEDQLESAAITYCREIGIDPWEEVLGDRLTQVGSIRTIAAVPRYKTVIPEIRRALAMQKALEVGDATPESGVDDA